MIKNLIQIIKRATLIEWMVIAAIIFILLGIVFGGVGHQSNEKINPSFNPSAAQAQAMQKQNELKEQELELMKENNRLLRELKNK